MTPVFTSRDSLGREDVISVKRDGAGHLTISKTCFTGRQDDVWLTFEEARHVSHFLDELVSLPVCPPECSNGIDMVPETINIDGHRLDVWTCPVCGRMRTRRI